jgi:hypothetical protein
MGSKRLRGGKRTGAGRKPDPGKIKVISKAITLPPELWEWIDRQDGSRGSVVKGLVECKIKREDLEMEDQEKSCSDCKFCFREHNAGDLMCGFPPHEEEGYPCSQDELDYGCTNYVKQ